MLLQSTQGLAARSIGQRRARGAASSSRRRVQAVMATSVWLGVREVAIPPGDRPDVGRSGAAAVSLPPGHTHAALLLGGYTEHASPDGSAQPFTRFEVMDGFGYEEVPGRWQAVQFTGDSMPPPRMAHQAVCVGSYVYMIGGWHPQAGGEGQFLDDVWRLDVGNWSWSKVQPTGEQLPRISRFQAVAVGNRIYIHYHRCTDFILVMDVTDPDRVTLSKVPVTGDVPSSRGMHSLTLVPGTNKLVLFGGAPQQGPMLGDLYELDLGTHVWSKVQPEGTQPHTRCSHTAVALPDGKHILYHGGAYYKDEVAGGGGLQVLDDLFLYNVSSKAWVYPLLDGSSLLPPARNAHVMVPLPPPAGLDCPPVALMHAGWVPFTSTFNDTYVISVRLGAEY